MASKHKHISPIKGVDKCAACKDNLNVSSNAMNYDSCEQWLCADSLDLSESKHIIFANMTRCRGCEWKCSMCKGNPKSSADASEIAKIVDSSLKKSLSGLYSTVKNLDLESKEAATDSFFSLKAELKAEIDTNFTSLEGKVCSLERSSSPATDEQVIKDLVTPKKTTQVEVINEQFEIWTKALTLKTKMTEKKIKHSCL